MKVASLIIGILLMALSAVVLLICLMLPSMTHNRVNFQEAFVGIVPSILFFFIGLIMVVIGGVLLIKGRQSVSSPSGQVQTTEGLK